MKKSVYLFMLLFVGIFTAFKTSQENNLGKVNKLMGVYVFTDSEPVQEYEVLGTVTISMVWTPDEAQYQPLKKLLITKGLKKYPKSEAAILDFGNTDTATMIRFVE